MKMQRTSILAIGTALAGLNQTVLASTASSTPLPSFTQSAGHQPAEPIILAAGVGTRVERRHDAVENTADRVDDKQDHRQQRRDCVGDGPDCRSDNRQDKRQNTVDRAEDRVDDRRDRR